MFLVVVYLGKVTILPIKFWGSKFCLQEIVTVLLQYQLLHLRLLGPCGVMFCLMVFVYLGKVTKLPIWLQEFATVCFSTSFFIMSSRSLWCDTFCLMVFVYLGKVTKLPICLQEFVTVCFITSFSIHVPLEGPRSKSERF